MPGGIGPVSESTISACTRQDRRIVSANNPNEIFFHLDHRRVFYDSVTSRLYFIASRDGLVMRTVCDCLTGLNSGAAIEQVYLDPHRCFSGASRITLTATHANTLLIALRLAGIRVTVN